MTKSSDARMTVAICQGIARSGQRCRARPIVGTDWCINHSPAITDAQRRAWKARGGHNSAALVRARKQLPMEPLTSEEVASYLSIGIRGVLTKSVAPAVLNAISNAARALSEIRRDAEFEVRLEALERDAATRTTWTG